MRPPVRSWLAFVGLAMAGVVAGHGATYRLLVPSPALRQRLLAETGHAHWTEVAAVSAVVAGIAVLAVVLRALRGDREAGPSSGWGTRLLLLAGVQAVLFTGLELAERALVSAAPGGGLRHLLPLGFLLSFGVAVQVAVASVATLLLQVAVGCASSRAPGQGRSAPAPAPPRLWVPWPNRPLGSLRTVGTCGVRGPPLPLR